MDTRGRITIFEYTEYRLFLNDYYLVQKRLNRHFSFRLFAQRAAVAPSLLKDILSGRRNLTLTVMQKYATAMRLNSQEVKYFELLVKYNNCKHNRGKSGFFSEMLHLRNKAGIKFLGEHHYTFFSKWYHSAIRELITLAEFQEDPQWVANKLIVPISPAQVKKSLELLEEIGVVVRDAHGKLDLKDAIVSSEYEMASAVLRQFHQQMIELAAQVFENVPREKREISSLTLGVSFDCFDKIKERIRLFKEEILTMVVEDNAETQTVCQLNFQLFPLIRDSDVK
ncbi:MAG: TIGR02147 family protein [Chitinivibrionales bacterium]|nr:TIGR02147 family protein [Chitinivibrionales bacterium]